MPHRTLRPSVRRRAPVAVSLACALLLAACASSTPAPIVSRTTPAARPATPAPAQATPPAAVSAPAPAPTPDPTVQTAPIRSGTIESRGIEARPLEPRPPGAVPAPGAAPAPGAVPAPGVVPPASSALPPNTRTTPRGAKVPYSEATLAELRAAEAAAPSAPAAAAPAPSVPSAPAATPPAPAAAVPPATASSGPAPESKAVEGEGDWSWPTPGKVMQSFSESGNKGVVIGGKVGDPVLAASDGKVIFSGTGPRGYGNLVIVKHANELLSVYAHNRSLAVKEGQSVKRGQKIAELGDSGTTSPRLHFEIRQQGKPVDPARYLPKR